MLTKIRDIRLYKYLIIFYSFISIIDAGRKIYWKLGGNFYQTLTWKELLVYNMMFDWILVISFMIIISYWTRKMFEKQLNWKLIIFIHVCLGFLMGYFVFAIAGCLVYLLRDYSFDQILENVSFGHFMSVVDVNFLSYFSMIGIIYLYFYAEKVKVIEQQKSKLEVQLVNTKLHTLIAQLHPHFMFNTLNSISSLIETDREKSQDLIADFGDLFRDILDSKNESKVPLTQELQTLQRYLNIVSVRFSDHLTIVKEIDDDIGDALVPNMLLQPLLENSIKHGYSINKTELIIYLKIKKDGKYVNFTIENNGEPLNGTLNELMTKGIGLRNTRDRLISLFGDDFEFTMTNNANKTKIVIFVKIPLEFKEA